MYGCIKHFPGHGATLGDTHNGYAYTDKSWEELKASDIIPFQRCIAEGISFVMVGHISLPQAIGDDVPASCSQTAIQGYLRGELGYQGIVLTDALNMGAIVDQYSSAQAVVKAFQAGSDMLLMPADFRNAYQGVLDAVNQGTISQERLNESVTRILKVKTRNSSNFQFIAEEGGGRSIPFCRSSIPHSQNHNRQYIKTYANIKCRQ